MLYGDHIPFRFGERVENGKRKYDAITWVSYAGDEATASGLSDSIKLSHTRELRNKLREHGVVRFMHYRNGSKVIFMYHNGKWRLVKNEVYEFA